MEIAYYCTTNSMYTSMHTYGELLLYECKNSGQNDLKCVDWKQCYTLNLIK